MAFPADIQRLVEAKPNHDGQFVALPVSEQTAVILAELLETFRRMNSPWLNLTEAASYLGVSPSLICLWKNQGKLEAHYGPEMKHARFRRTDLDALMNRAGGRK